MKITDLIARESIIASLQAQTKQEVLIELTKAALHEDAGDKIDNVIKVLLDREKLGSTGIGDGTAIPHGKIPAVTTMKIAFGRSLAGIDFNALDGRPVYLFFLLLAPEHSQGMHLRVLARISRMVRDASFRSKLMQAKSTDEIYEIISSHDDAS